MNLECLETFLNLLSWHSRTSSPRRYMGDFVCGHSVIHQNTVTALQDLQVANAIMLAWRHVW